VLYEFDAADWGNPATYTWTDIAWPGIDRSQDAPLVAALADGRIVAGSIFGGYNGGPNSFAHSSSFPRGNVDADRFAERPNAGVAARARPGLDRRWTECARSGPDGCEPLVHGWRLRAVPHD
jgi:hypothetical protein